MVPFCFSSSKLSLFGFPEPARPVLSEVDASREDRKQVSGAIRGLACVGADGPRSATRVTLARPASPCTLETAPPVSWLQNKESFQWLQMLARRHDNRPPPPSPPLPAPRSCVGGGAALSPGAGFISRLCRGRERRHTREFTVEAASFFLARMVGSGRACPRRLSSATFRGQERTAQSAASQNLRGTSHCRYSSGVHV